MKKKKGGFKKGYYWTDLKQYIMWWISEQPVKGTAVIGDLSAAADFYLQNPVAVEKFTIMMDERNEFLRESKRRANDAVDEDKKKETLRKFQAAALAKNKSMYGTPEWKAMQEKSWDNPERRKKASDTMKQMRANMTEEEQRAAIEKSMKTKRENPHISIEGAKKNKAVQLETYRKTIKLIYDTIQFDDWFTVDDVFNTYTIPAPRVKKGQSMNISWKMYRIYFNRSIKSYEADGIPLMFEKELRSMPTGRTTFWRKIPQS